MTNFEKIMELILNVIEQLFEKLDSVRIVSESTFLEVLVAILFIRIIIDFFFKPRLEREIKSNGKRTK